MSYWDVLKARWQNPLFLTDGDRLVQLKPWSLRNLFPRFLYLKEVKFK